MIQKDVAQKVFDITLTKIARSDSVFSQKSSLHKNLLMNQVLTKAKNALTFSPIPWEDTPQVTPSLHTLTPLNYDTEKSVEINRNGYFEQEDLNLKNISGVDYDAEIPDKESSDSLLCERLTDVHDAVLDCESDEIDQNDCDTRNLLKRKVNFGCCVTSQMDNKRPKLSRPTYNVYENLSSSDPQSTQHIGALITVFNSGFQGLLSDDDDSQSNLECHAKNSQVLCSNQCRTVENMDYSMTATPLAMTV